MRRKAEAIHGESQILTEGGIAKARMASAGRVTIPRVVRERLGLRPGDELEFLEEEGVFRLRKRVPAAAVAKHRGYLGSLAGQDPDAVVGAMREP